jgi:RNA polymerase sigma-70 factor (ECF subfamily)
VIKTSRRLGELSSEGVDDLIQETYLRIFSDDCQVLRSLRFQDTAKVFGWVQAVAFSVVHDSFRQKMAQKRGGGLKVVPLEPGHGEVGAGSPTEAYERTIILQRIDSLVGTVAPAETVHRDRAVFWLYYRNGLTAKAISELPAVNLTAKGVESLIQRLTAAVRQQILAMPPQRPSE